MRRSRRVLVAVLAGIVVGISAAVMSIASMGAGHGDYAFAKLLYPFAMIAFRVLGEIPPAISLLSLLQFPAYAALIAVQGSSRAALVVTIAVSVTHSLAIAIAW